MEVIHTEYAIGQATVATVAPNYEGENPSTSTIVTAASTFETDYEIERQKPMPSKLHARIQGNIYFEIRKAYEQYDVYPELSLELTSGKAVPDIALLNAETVDFSQDEIKVKTVPQLVVEILSPRHNIDEIKEKITNIYCPAGLKSIWLVIPPLQTVSLVLPNGQFKTFTEGVVKDLYLDIELNMADIFK